MPCWAHEANLATLSNTWFLCDRCREAMSFAEDVAAALEHDSEASTSDGAIAESLPKAGSELAEAALPADAPSPPPGARPERDPAAVLTFSSSTDEAATVVYMDPPPPDLVRQVYAFSTDSDPGDAQP